jgi:uncharacterized membrane protein
MSTNPYTAPKTDVAAVGATPQRNFVAEGHPVPAGHGWTWIADAWELFKRAPALWIGMVLSLVVILLILALIPYLGSILSMALSPVFAAGLMLGCRTLEEGGQLEFRHLFAGFQTRTGTLIGVGLLYLAAIIAIALVVGVITGAGMFALFSVGASASAGAAFTTIALAILIMLALMMPLAMAIWFAPPLVVFSELGAFDALKASFLGCLKNIVPFLIYGLIVFGFAILASIPLCLGWLVLAPVIGASIYTSYRDIYFG